MWVLILMIVTADKSVAVYDQGIYDDMSQCIAVKKAMLDDDFKNLDNVQLTCVRWQDN